jgi:ribosomal protein S6--L-glutamate ligase
MKLCVISLGGKSSLQIVEEGKAFFDESEHVDLRTLEVHASSQGLKVLSSGKELQDFDCVYIRGSYKYRLLQEALTSAYVDKAYLPLRAGAFSIGHNKFLTLLALAKKGIHIPTTYLAGTTKAARNILDEVHYPVIMKTPYGTQGKGVMVADSLKAAKSMLDALEVFHQPYMIQEYIETDSTDIRAVVVGNKVYGMKRQGGFEDMRANIHAGGKGEVCYLDPNTQHLALKCAKLIGAEVCAVDILEGVKPAVIEVNLSPGLAGITKATKKNMAGLIARFLADRTTSFLLDRDVKKNGKIFDDLQKQQGKEYFAPLDVRHGMIRLPKFITDLSEFTMDDEVTMVVRKGKIEINDSKIKKD